MLWALVLLAATTHALTPLERWHEFKREYARTYSNPEEEAYRYSVFLQVKCLLLFWLTFFDLMIVMFHRYF